MSDSNMEDGEKSGRFYKPSQIVTAEAELARVLHRISERGGEELSHLSDLMSATWSEWGLGEGSDHSENEEMEWRPNLHLSYNRSLPFELKMCGGPSILFASLRAKFRLFDTFPALLSLDVRWRVDGKTLELELCGRDLLLLLSYPDTAVAPAILARCVRRHVDEVKAA